MDFVFFWRWYFFFVPKHPCILIWYLHFPALAHLNNEPDFADYIYREVLVYFYNFFFWGGGVGGWRGRVGVSIWIWVLLQYILCFNQFLCLSVLDFNSFLFISIYLALCFVFLFFYFYLFVYLFICLFVCLFIYLFNFGKGVPKHS